MCIKLYMDHYVDRFLYFDLCHNYSMVYYYCQQKSHSIPTRTSRILWHEIFHLIVRTCPHRDSCTAFRQILPLTALKILEGRQPVGGFLPCHRQNYA